MRILRECPQHKAPLTLRIDAQGRGLLLCPEGCDYTEALPEDIRMQRDPRARRLPGF